MSGLHFTGLSSAILLKAAAALAAVVVVFYILKLKRRPIPVPFAPLWQRILRDKEATTLFSQLKRLLSLLLQLALLVLMLLSLGDPRPAVTATTGRHVLVLIDSSASMKAVDVPQPRGIEEKPEKERVYKTRLDAGKEKIRETIRGLSGTDRMLIAQMDGAVTPLSTMTGEINELEKALGDVRASDVRANYAAALRFAIDSLRGLSKPEIVVVSDGALGEPVDAQGPVDLGDVKLSYVKVGEGGRNVAITGFAVRRYPLDKSRYEVLLEVTNTSDENAEVDLELYGDGQMTDIVELRLGGKESVSRFYANLSGADKTLEARVKLKNGKDVLPVDDRAYALLPERRRARVQVVTKGNMYLEAALLLDEYLEVLYVAPGKYPGEGKFDVTIFDGVAPPVTNESGSVLYLNPPSDEHTPFKLGDKLKDEKNARLAFSEVDGKHPIVRFVSLTQVKDISRARVIESTDKHDVAVAKSAKGTLLLYGRRKGHKFVALGMDIRESGDFPLLIAWPMLLMNVISDFIDEDTSYISSYRTGEVWAIPASAGGKTATLKLPGGVERVVPIKDGRAVFLGQEAGVYDLKLDDGKTLFAANLSDVAESTITPMDSLTVGKAKAGTLEGFTVGVRRELWVYFLAAVLLVSALEWLTFHRRLTV
jgi:hypothetical protein